MPEKELEEHNLDECYCYIDFDGAGYVYLDEYGPCPHCEGEDE